MKLYTEEQVRETWNKAYLQGMSVNKLVVLPIGFIEHLESLTPIELQSKSICVNCDATKPIHKVCMDCIIKMGKENIELPSEEDLLVPFPTEEDGKFENGNEIKCWMNGWEKGYLEAIQSLRDKIKGYK